MAECSANPNTRRIGWIDFARAIAILLVVFTHCHEISEWKEIIPVSIAYSIDRLGVPLFFMISGALTLPKASAMSPWAFYKRRLRIPQFIFLIFFWTVLTNAIGLVVTEHSSLARSFNFALQKRNGISSNYGLAVHMWFMYAIISIYLLMPFLAKLAVKLSTREIVILIAVMVLLYQFNDTLRIVLKIHPDNYRYAEKNDFEAYFSYFLIGFLIAHRIKIQSCFKVNLGLALAIIVMALFSLALDLRFNQAIPGGIHWYSYSLAIFIAGVCILVLIKNLTSKRWKFNTPRYVYLLSRYSFGIYLSHVFFIYLAKVIMQRVGYTPDNMYTNAIILFVFSLLSSFALTALLSKQKYLKFLVI